MNNEVTEDKKKEMKKCLFGRLIHNLSFSNKKKRFDINWESFQI